MMKKMLHSETNGLNKALLLFLIFFISFIANSQSIFENIKIPKTESLYPYEQCEPSIVIHPKNQNIIAAGSVMDGFYISKNGGKSWEAEQLKSKFGVNGDPVLIFDSTGCLYYFHLSNYPKTSRLDRIVCQTKKKIDKPFSKGSYPSPNGNKVQDKHWVAVHPCKKEICMTWTQFDKYNSSNPKDSSIILFSKSKNKGRKWSKPKRISTFGGDCLDGDNTVEGAFPAYGVNGEIYVVWTGPKGFVFQKSSNGGKTWLKNEIPVGPHPGGWTYDIPGIYRCNGLPILVCDHSNGPNRGTLYLNWTDQRNGKDDTDVWLSKSKDGGTNWSKPIKVNQDKGKAQQFLSWMSIDQSDGTLYFVFYDRRNYSTLETDVYLAYSKDGGKSFLEERVSKEPFIPNEKVFFGDYLNISSVNGMIMPIWPRMDQRKISLWVAPINKSQLK